MSDRITWEVCPSCGKAAAVGWTMIRWATGERFQEVPLEFDCPSGCRLNVEQLRREFMVAQEYGRRP